MLTPHINNKNWTGSLNRDVVSALTLTSPCFCFYMFWRVIVLYVYLWIWVNWIESNLTDNILPNKLFSLISFTLLSTPEVTYYCLFYVWIFFSVLSLDVFFIFPLLSLQWTLRLLCQYINQSYYCVVYISITIVVIIITITMDSQWFSRF